MYRLYFRGRGMPLKKNNIDTDQIMPARFCYKPTKRGHEDSVFGDWREDPNFIMNNPYYQRATILVTGREFATGSSREFAVWGLKDWGFKAVIAPSFGDIFYKNASLNDLLPVILDEVYVERILNYLFEDHYAEILIDLNRNVVEVKNEIFPLIISDFVRSNYLQNKDDINETLKFIDVIKKFELKRGK
ncbi:MAG TPA: 3-isopropylmalate dehydratase small subunit [Gallibacterium anatis]|uniref:3-isopropylmalate dehydratase n=2 Tax=Gallibacterium anatis TaxID=750 RepID=A0A921HAY1_9PAST|nr:3-isopropylmalate dehydratase small subunit [Gallibacterium anatis]